MRPCPVSVLFGSSFRSGLALLPLLALLHPVSANAAFHLNEITKVMVGLNGNNTVQAVELKMLSGGENLVAGMSIKVYDAGGAQLDSLGSFSGSVPNGIAGRFILCATPNFAAIFGITPDLTIKPGLLVGTGQVSFEKPSCFVNSLAYGSVTTPKTGTTSAAALPTDLATALVRTIDDGTAVFCPLAEDAAARFQLRSGTSGTPITFTNNSGVSVNVFPTASGVDVSPPASAGLRVYPNPFTKGARIVAPGYGYLSVYDVRGRMVRSWGSLGVSPAVLGPMRLDWDGTDAAG
ncbi:MAG TPA: hypothetical protein VGK76_08705, partial [Candidatus Eisenbacteria bacterium]